MTKRIRGHGKSKFLQGTLLNPLIKLERNSDLVKTSSIDAIDISGTQLSAMDTYGDYLVWWLRTDRIRQTGSINQIRLNIITKTNISEIWFYVWRKITSESYVVVGKENITSKITAGITQTVTLTTPIAVQEGDYTASMYRSTWGAVNVIWSSAHTAGCKLLYTAAPNEAGHNWGAAAGAAFTQHIYTYMQAPLIVGLGDSVGEGYPLHSSYIDGDYTYEGNTKTWLYKLSQLDVRCVYQNCSKGGLTTNQIKSYFDNYVVAAKPKIVILNGGLNDIDLEVITLETFLANYTEMLDKCVVNSIVPVVLAIGPWSGSTNAKMQKRDLWNAALKTLVATYAKSKFVDTFDALMGQFRVGGDAGNLWDMQTAYNQGGCHYNEAGNAIIASEIYKKLL